MEKNYTGQSLSLAIIVLLLLTGISVIPKGTFLDMDYRKMDIFSDIRDSVAMEQPVAAADTLSVDTLAYSLADTAAIAADTMPLPDSLRMVPLKDSVFFGRLIEDYTFDQNGLASFFKAVDSIKTGRTVRIAWYGDSFVEGDILVGDLRDSLQSAWGGAGVGFVPITSEVAQFKRTLKHNFRGWTAFSIIKKDNFRPALGLNGYAYKPEPEAKVHFEGTRYFRHTQRWNRVQLFYTAQQNNSVVWQIKDEAPRQEVLPGRGDKLCTWRWKGLEWGTDAFAMRFPQPEGFIAYGLTLENGPGIYIDNFSIRGNSGGPLKLISPEFVQQFDAVQQYDLVVLQVGLNAVTNSLNNIRWYEAELERTFKHLKACFPGKPILIVSVGDRGGKAGDRIETMRGVPAIVQMQRKLARKHGFLFYDLFWGMGGPDTMLKFAHQRPRLANTDYTHLTHDGGKVVGLMFARLFLQEQATYKAKSGLQ
ncbi:MAG TPA: GDSL-type esterase/lipase family protein [Saprospiraceae bacterium]|nr:GDSL-type esterase/lipase family protein [Saprospiraceae bacterium]